MGRGHDDWQQNKQTYIFSPRIRGIKKEKTLTNTAFQKHGAKKKKLKKFEQPKIIAVFGNPTIQNYVY